MLQKVAADYLRFARRSSSKTLSDVRWRRVPSGTVGGVSDGASSGTEKKGPEVGARRGFAAWAGGQHTSGDGRPGKVGEGAGKIMELNCPCRWMHPCAIPELSVAC